MQDADGATGAATTTVLLVGPNEVYANQVAAQLRGIPIDVTGAVYWTEQFLQGAPRTELTEKLVHDFHYLDRLLRTVYQQFLGRPIDDSGERYWVNRMLNGLTDEQLEASFVSSAEFYLHAGGSNAGWIEAMYESLLGRQADATGMNYWLSALNLGTSRTSAAIGFATSAEHEAHVLRDDYMTYLGRQASADEVFYWTSQFKRGLSNEDIVAQFTASDEYFKSHS